MTERTRTALDELFSLSVLQRPHLYMDCQVDMLVCKSCSSKSSRTLQLLTIEMYFVMVLEARSSRPRGQQGWFCLEALRENRSHASLQPLVVAINPLLSSLPSCDFLVSLCLFWGLLHAGS